MSSAVPITSGRGLARSTIWNLIGQGAPMLVAVVSIPILIKGLGVDRFGVLTLAWMVVGYFSLFDFGLGRALTKLVAEKLGSGAQTEIPSLIWTTLGLVVALGILGTGVTAALTPWIVATVLRIPPHLYAETIETFYLLALSMPVVLATDALRGILEANQRFGLVNAVRIPMGVFTFVGPVVALAFSRNLDAAVTVLVAGRWVAGLVHLGLCWKTFPSLMRPLNYNRAMIRPLLSFGGWITVSNVISPLMVYVDRFVIGNLVSISAVAYYVTPYEVITKLGAIPNSLVAVLFPAFSTSLASDPKHAALLLDRGMRYVFLITFPVAIVVVSIAEGALNLWLGSDFALQSTRVLQWLAAGVFINGLALLPFVFIHGAGRPDRTAKLHLVELPFYLLALWWGVQTLGIKGAAVVWVARVAVDALAIFLIARRLVGGGEVFRRVGIGIGVASALLLLAGLLNGGTLGIGFLALVLAMYGPVAWRFVLGPEERTLLREQLRAWQATR